MDSFDIPHGALDVAIPRTPSRILLQTLIVHVFSLVTYLYLCELLPRTKGKSFFELAVQLILFWNLPELLPLQLTSFILGTFIEDLGLQKPRFLVQYARLVGLSNFKSRKHVTDIQRSTYFKVVIVTAMVCCCMASLLAYVDRFGVGYHAATDVGMLGIDHRNGWVSAEGLLAGVVAILYRIYIWFGLDRGTGDVVGAGFQAVIYGIDEGKPNDSPLYTSQNDQTQTDLSFENKAMLAEAFFATIVHQIPLAATHRKTQLFSLMIPAVAVVFLLSIVSSRQSRPSVARKAQLLLILIGILAVIWTVVEIVTIDVGELNALQEGKVHPWNFRWKATDRMDRFLRVFV